MKKLHGLHNARDFRLLFQSGRKLESPLFGVRARPNKLSHSRLAFIVPSSVDKRAVVRNKLKRQIRAWIRKEETLLTKPLDIAFFFKKEATKASRKNFYEELRKASSRISE